MLSVRPKVAELSFQLFGRPLHPELFRIHATRQIERGEYQARLQITSAGHLVTWRYAGLTLTEVATSAQQPLPIRRRMMIHRLDHAGSDRATARCGATYQVGFQVELAAPEVFWSFQQNLLLDSRRQGLLHRFDSAGRMSTGAISYLYVETRQRALLVHAYHTFPDDFAIVKTQSCFEIPTARRG